MHDRFDAPSGRFRVVKRKVAGAHSEGDGLLRFVECMRVMLEAGATLDNPLLEAILLDDDTRLGELLLQEPQKRGKRFHLECAYTSLHGVSPLHVCAEYNSVKCARALLEPGADVNARAESPISYARCGLYFQFHRKEENGYGNIAYLWRRKYGSEMKVRNVPNKYLEDARVFPPRM